MQISPINDTTYGCKVHLDDVEIGDVLASTFKPHIKMKRFNGLCDFALSYPTNSTKLVMFADNKITFPESNNLDIEISTIAPDQLRPEGAMELNIILKKKPPKNKIILKLETNTIDFQKIVGLDKEYDQARCQEKWTETEPGGRQGTYTITPTKITHDASGEVMKERPEYLVNSYEGKAKQNYQVTSELGEIRANTSNKGKQLTYTKVSRTTAHIKRGKMIDADGVEAWVEDMNLGLDGNLVFTLPNDFLKSAKYPIRQAVGVDPAYTEDMDNWVTDYGNDSTWEDYDLFTNKGVPKGAVAEVIIANQETGVEAELGIRTDGSALARYVDIHEAEGGGVTTCRMFVLCDASTGLVETWADDVSDVNIFYLVGYWENVGFTETWSFAEGSGYDQWVDSQLDESGAAGRVCHMSIYATIEADYLGGVRANGSSLERKVLLHEAEGGGVSPPLDMFVKADANYTIEHYRDGASLRIMHMGYFGSEMDFVGLFQSITNDGDSDWDATDLTAYLDEDGRVCDFMLSHNVTDAEHTLGVRDGDDSTTNRYILEHEAEDDGSSSGEVTGFGISAKSNASGVVNLYSSTASEVFYLMGYFKPAAVGGWAHKYLGVANASIAKINGVAIASISKVNGVA